MDHGRRELLAAAVAVGVSATAGRGLAAAPQGKKAEEVSPGEDLMREHGVLGRILLIYDEAARRLDAKQDLPPQSLAEAAGLVRSFIEDYHEKLEEDHLFPRFRKAGRLVELVEVLLAQHQAGRRLTDRVLRLATPPSLKSADDRAALIRSLREFNRMYLPHAAREDTVLFPALHELVSQNEYDAMGEQFEKEEQRRFGQDGFEKVVDRVAAIEKRLGIYDLAKFTPRL